MSEEKFPFEEKTEELKKEEKPKASVIEIDSHGLVLAKNNTELLRYCGAIISSGVVPERFDTPQKLFGALMFARSLGLPDIAIRQIAVIHQNPSLFGDLPLALVQKTNELSYFKEQWFDKDYNVICFENKNVDAEAYGAVCFIRRKSMGEEIQSFSFTLEDAKKAGLYPEKNAHKPWAKYTKIMLRYRARSIALKSLFADKINGVSIAEYDHDAILVNGKVEGAREVKDVTTEINNAYLPEASKDKEQKAIEVDKGETLRDM